MRTTRLWVCATEAAQASLKFGFQNVGLSEIVALTVPGNARSRPVMSKLGMTRTPIDDFDHPLVPAGHPLTRHVLYRLSKNAWLARMTSAGHRQDCQHFPT
ncbi:GNAT family N-acetyltransferase [Variovorax sp. PBS-H4]|uniref:GNAT family N-acetyltransferase n=1 Tax=Variovorax sp. PBS-H4 TaxID=434008 RepID=UPI0013A5AA0F|nr:GNAT family protein [Variovorax sp. PBS-H4]